jgi:sodium/potassium/calcium exchanger 6
MEDLDAIDRMCIQEGSAGLPAYNWMGAIYDSRQELAGHLKECWREIIEDEESGRVEKFLLICEFPVTLLRKVG